MKASVVIATYGRDTCLVDTVRSVLMQDYPDFELVVVDQSARHTPEVERFLRNLEDPRYSYYLITPPSLPAARNFGLARSSGEIVIYVDDDVQLDPHFIDIHVSAYGRMERLAALGGRVRCQGQGVSTHLFSLLADGSWSGGYDFPEEADLDTVQGCNMSFRRSALEGIGGFDPSYEGSAQREESDVCFRLRRRGYEVRYEPKAALDHLVAPAGGCRERDLRDGPYFYQNETIFILRHLRLWLFCVYFAKSFRNQVWTQKRDALFWTRLSAFSRGVTRGIRLALFPKKMQPDVVWQSSRTADLRTPAKVGS